MEVHFTPEEEMRLQQVAARGGKAAEDVVQAAVRQVLQDEARFVEAVQKGIAADDLERIAEVIARDRPDAALRTARTIYEGVAFLRDC